MPPRWNSTAGRHHGDTGQERHEYGARSAATQITITGAGERAERGTTTEGLAGGSLSLPNMRAIATARRELDRQSDNGICRDCNVGSPYGSCGCPGWRLAGWSWPTAEKAAVNPG